MLNQSTTASFIPISKPRLCLHLLRLGPQAILPPHSLPPRTSTWRTHRFKPSGSPASSCPFLLVSPPTPRHSFLSLLGLSFSPSSIYLFSDPSSLSVFLQPFLLLPLCLPHPFFLLHSAGQDVHRGRAGVLGFQMLSARILVGTLGLSVYYAPGGLERAEWDRLLTEDWAGTHSLRFKSQGDGICL